MSKADDIQQLRANAATARRNNDPDLAAEYDKWADFLASSPAIDDDAAAKITSAVLSNDSDLAADNVAAAAQRILGGQGP